MTLHHIVQLNKFHTEAYVGFVASIETHGILPGHSREVAKFQTFNLLEKVFGQTFKHIEHIFLFHKRHLTINLRELGLTVCTEILVTEATHYLEITVHTCHHQQLLILLRTLWKSIEFTWIHARRDYKITSAFRGRFDQHRSLYLQEIAVAQVIADQHCHTMTQF